MNEVELINTEKVRSRMILIRGELSLLAGDVAALYGVEPREIAQAVKNNPAKFPQGYVADLNKEEISALKSKFLTLEKTSGRGHYSKRGYKAFTEKGLYMLATILKGSRAVEATLSIIETYAKVRELKRDLVALHTETNAKKKSSMMRHFGELLSDVVMPDLDAVETESSLEINFFIGKIKHTVRRIKRAKLEFGLHGYDHKWLGKLAEDEMRADISKAVDVFAAILPKNWCMCFPYGSFNDAAIAQAKSLGAGLGLSTEVRIANIGADNPMTLPRLDTNDFPPKSTRYKEF